LAANQAKLYDALQQSYDELQRTQEKAAEQERLRALGQMASGIAHDINNALAPVALYLESLLEQEPGLNLRTRSYLEVTQRAVDDVTKTVARMREFYRLPEPKLEIEPVDLSRIARHVIDLTRARWCDMPNRQGAVIDVRIEAPEHLPEAAGIESEIREALINLVLNAADSMAAGGTLTIRTGCSEAQRVYVEVSDTGVGMDEETRRRCLEPFFTTKGERGTGLGLAMVYGIVQRHGGELDIESVAGTGTTVRLKLPIAKAEFLESQPPDLSPVPLRILVVDDDPLVVACLGSILEAEGHTVTTASGGREGIDAFLEHAPGSLPFEMVITDLGMPYLDGYRVADAVKSASPGTPVILLTGWGRLITEADALSHVDRLLSKPPKLTELREALAELAPAVRTVS
jgi:CheY-like chemotaxis protein